MAQAAAAPTPLPTVVARIGMPLDEVLARSTYAFKPARLMDDDMTVATEPSLFTYPGTGGFTLPPTHFASFDTTAAVVQFIQVSPHLDPLHLQQAVDLVASVSDRMTHAGWTRDDHNMVTIDEARIRLRDPAGPDNPRYPVARLTLGTVETTLAIKRLRRASQAGAVFGGEDAFIMNVEIIDPALGTRLDRIAATLRQQDGVPDVRTIDLVPYLARVRPLLDPPP